METVLISTISTWDQIDQDARDAAADGRFDMAGAHQHRLLDHLVHLVVLLDQEFGAIADAETLMDEDRCLSPPL